MERASGILLHPTSLPGGSIGDLGDEAYRFADWLAEAGQRVWQVLPLGPVGYGESPYQLFSAFAGNPILVSLGDGARDQGSGTPGRVDFERAVPGKMAALRASIRPGEEPPFPWLEEFARFMALKAANGGKPWWEWD